MDVGGLTNTLFTDRLTMLLGLIVGLGLGTILLEGVLYWFFSRVLRTRHALAFTLLSPAIIALAAFTVYPFLYNIQLAFSDLRLKTLPCYVVSGVSTAPCPLGNLQEGKSATVAVGGLALHKDPGDDSPTVGQLASRTTITLVQQGKVAAPASSGASAGPTPEATTAPFDLGGATLPGQDTSGSTAQTQPTDDRTWWLVKPDSGVQGWVPETINDTPTLKREPVLYSLEYGLRNFRDVFFDTDAQTGRIIGWGRLLRTEGSTFPVLLARTVLWTLLNVIFHLIIGFGLALLMANSKLRLKGIYRLIILIPWAIPQVIAGLTWKQEFHSQYGFVNALLGQFGIAPVPWLTQPIPAFIAVLFVNIWLGVPFYMVVLTGGLGSISREYYEAAQMDGASVIQRFRNITIPLIRPIAVPIITLDAIWTFNMFNVIYLITEGEPAESTNILVTALYNAAFGRNGTYQLGFAAAFSILLFLLLLGVSTFWVRSSGALKGVYD